MMKILANLLLLILLPLSTLVAADTSSKPVGAAQPAAPETQAAAGKEEFQLAFGRITVGDKEVATAIEWNTRTGEAKMLNAASFADKSTGQQGNLIGWIPLVDLQQAVQNLALQIQQQSAAKTNATTNATNAPAGENKNP